MPVSTSQSRALELRAMLGQRVLVTDGAMGTMLYSKGAFINRCFDELNLSLPALVRDVHQEYLRAGADILETNTFGANRQRLQAFGFADKVRAINHAGVRIAREAARDKAFVAGAVGPLGARLAPLGHVQPEEARAIFREQLAALIEAGVDLVLFETFRDLNELREAVSAAREAGGADLIAGALVSIEDDGHLENGASPEDFTRALNEMPVEIVGLNCSSGPRIMLETLERMAPHIDKILCAMPNAGLPAAVDGRNIYLCSPDYMAQYARRFLDVGVKIVGGCCGSTPEHIKEIRNAASSFEPRNGDAPRATSVAVDERAERIQPLEKVPAADKSGLGAKLAAGTFVAFAEILPPRGADASKEVAGARLCKSAGIDCINVPDGPRAGARLSALVTCQLIQQEGGIETVLHLSCRDRNILSIQSELLGAHVTGLRNLMCVTGDPPRMGAYPDATSAFDVDSIGLVNIANQLNRGLDLGGNPLASRTALLIGVGVNPGAFNLDREMARFEAKVEAGAEYAVTRPVFDLQLLEAFLRRVEPLKIPVVAGIWPLTSFRNAEFMVNELRVPVPADYMNRMRSAGHGETARAEGIAIAREMVQRVRTMVAGVQLAAPFGQYQMAVDVAQAIGPRDSLHL